jgi:hypothetical protein
VPLVEPESRKGERKVNDDRRCPLGLLTDLVRCDTIVIEPVPAGFFGEMRMPAHFIPGECA